MNLYKYSRIFPSLKTLMYHYLKWDVQIWCLGSKIQFMAIFSKWDPSFSRHCQEQDGFA